MNNTEVLKQLQIESFDLAAKCDRLANFIASERFAKIGSIQQDLLPQQLVAMQTYHEILLKRITDLSFPQVEELVEMRIAVQ